MEYSYAFLILLLPFLSFLVLGLCGMKMKKPVAGLIGTIMLGSLFAMSLYTAYEYFFVIGRNAATGLYPTVTVFNFTWLKFTELLTFNIGFRLTPISVMMLIVITTVSFMVHIYSFGYMAERDDKYKFELDVCATDDNAKCARYFTEEIDGLSQEWKGVCWMNPPYGRTIKQWMKKSIRKFINGCNSRVFSPCKNRHKLVA